MFDTGLLPSLSRIVIAGLCAAQAYAQKAKEKPTEHGMGPPHLQIAMVMLKVLLTETFKDSRDPHYKPMCEIYEEMKSSKLMSLKADYIRHWHLKPCFAKQGEKPEQARLHFALFGGVIIASKVVMYQTCLSRLLESLPESSENKYDRKIGPAPRGTLERSNDINLKKLKRIWGFRG